MYIYIGTYYIRIGYYISTYIAIGILYFKQRLVRIFPCITTMISNFTTFLSFKYLFSVFSLQISQDFCIFIRFLVLFLG